MMTKCNLEKIKMVVNKMYPIWHRTCGTVLFYYKEQPNPDGIVKTELSVYSDGTQPKKGDYPFCNKCKSFVYMWQLGFIEVQQAPKTSKENIKCLIYRK